MLRVLTDSRFTARLLKRSGWMKCSDIVHTIRRFFHWVWLRHTGPFYQNSVSVS